MEREFNATKVQLLQDCRVLCSFMYSLPPLDFRYFQASIVSKFLTLIMYLIVTELERGGEDCNTVCIGKHIIKKHQN